ncbi:MAG TPA: membrane dipeptidase, partial [Nitrososphaerales archaeon]|nr:membrane dipeptidase [Nitrososphaerales archaeon]
GLGFGPKDFSVDQRGRHVDIPKYRRSNVKLVFASVAPLSRTVEPRRAEHLARMYQTKPESTVTSMSMAKAQALEQLKIYRNILSLHRKSLMGVETARELSALWRLRKTGLLISLEGSEPLEDLDDLWLFFRLGVRSLHLTWNYDNRYSASCMSKKDYGLTGDGEELVARANEIGVIMDMAHSSKKASMELMRMTKLPPIFSHANSRSVKDHVRNADDEQIALLSRKGGVMGFDFISSTIGDRPSVQRLADHVMHVYDEFGPGVLALGSDFLGTSSLPEGLKNVEEVANLWSELMKRGMRREDIEKMAWRNALRVVERNSRRWSKAAVA